MERVRKHAINIFIIMLLCTIAIAVTPVRRYQVPNQEYYVERVPKNIGNFSARHTSDMREVWEALSPDGIVWSVYEGPGVQWIDFVFLSGRSSDAFHDPQLCFRNQGWNLEPPVVKHMRIDSLSQDIPVNVLSMTNTSGVKATAIYFFIGPFGYTANPFVIKMSLFAAKSLGISAGQGYFIRFIVPTETSQEDDLEKIRRFASDIFAVLKTTLPEAIKS
jgi:hypothetical protein